MYRLVFLDKNIWSLIGFYNSNKIVIIEGESQFRRITCGFLCNCDFNQEINCGWMSDQLCSMTRVNFQIIYSIIEKFKKIVFVSVFQQKQENYSLIFPFWFLTSFDVITPVLLNSTTPITFSTAASVFL